MKSAKHRVIDSFLHQTFIEVLPPQVNVLDGIETRTMTRKALGEGASRGYH